MMCETCGSSSFINQQCQGCGGFAGGRSGDADNARLEVEWPEKMAGRQEWFRPKCPPVMFRHRRQSIECAEIRYEGE